MNPPPPSRGASRDGSINLAGHSRSAVALTIGAAGTGAAAVAVDVLAGERPSHTVALVVLVGAIVMIGRYIAPRLRGLLHLLNATVVSQPALHLAGKWIGGGAESAARAAPPEFPRSLLPDEVTGGQVVISLLIVLAVLAVGRMAELAAGTAHRRARWLLWNRPGQSTGIRGVQVCVDWRGSMLCRCGWVLMAARRGPPPAVLPAV